MQNNNNNQHPLYPEREIERMCPKCSSTDVYKVRSEWFCLECEKRNEDALIKEEKAYKDSCFARDIDFEIKEAKYNGGSYSAKGSMDKDTTQFGS